MRCPDFRDHLDDYCRGKLDQDMVISMDSHIASCDSCAAEYNEHYSLISLLAKEPDPAIDPYELADFLPGVWEKIESKQRIPLTGWLKRFASAAVAVILFGLVIIRPPIYRPAYTVAEYESSNLEYSLLSSDYIYPTGDTVYTEDTYSDILSNFFSDDDSDALDVYDEQLNSGGGLFSENSIDISTMSEESLEILDEKLQELLSNAG